MSGKPGRSGRLTVYTPEIARQICQRLADGESLNAICKDPQIPPRTTVIEWVEDNRDGFADKYARSRQRGFELMAEELIAISDEPCLFDGKPDTVLVQQARLMSDNRKWLLSKMLPRQFGDRVTQELVGDDARPLVTRIELIPVAPRPRQIASPAKLEERSGEPPDED